MNTSSESGSYFCQKMPVTVHSSMLKHTVITVLRRGPGSLSHWTRTVNMVVSSKQIKTLLLASFWLPVREPAGIITPSFPQLIISTFLLPRLTLRAQGPLFHIRPSYTFCSRMDGSVYPSFSPPFVSGCSILPSFLGSAATIISFLPHWRTSNWDSYMQGVKI